MIVVLVVFSFFLSTAAAKYSSIRQSYIQYNIAVTAARFQQHSSGSSVHGRP